MSSPPYSLQTTSTRDGWRSVRGDDALSALDRIEIPNDIRQSIEDKPTPGSSLIISDEGKDLAIIPEGGDFIVLAKSTALWRRRLSPNPSTSRLGSVNQVSPGGGDALAQPTRMTISGVLINRSGHFSVGVGVGSVSGLRS